MFSKFDKPMSIRPETRYRIIGPEYINGMTVYRVHEVIGEGLTGRQIGPICFSLPEAVNLADDIAKGKISFFFGGIAYKKQSL